MTHVQFFYNYRSTIIFLWILSFILSLFSIFLYHRNHRNKTISVTNNIKTRFFKLLQTLTKFPSCIVFKTKSQHKIHIINMYPGCKVYHYDERQHATVNQQKKHRSVTSCIIVRGRVEKSWVTSAWRISEVYLLSLRRNEGWRYTRRKFDSMGSLSLHPTGR